MTQMQHLQYAVNKALKAGNLADNIYGYSREVRVWWS